MATSPAKPLRRDAERNRQRVLEAARRVFAERGLHATLDDIAHEAGVGVGTVYRRFPNKEELIDALFEDRVGEIVGAATESLEIEDPWEGFTAFLERAITMQAQDRGLKELLISTAHGRERVEHARERITPLAGALLARAQAAGVVRDDVELHDLILVQHALGQVGDYTRDAAPDAWRRLLVIVLDGLRPDRRRPTALPPGALDDATLLCAMQDWGARRR